MRREDGFTLVEVLTAATVMVVVLIATLTTLDRFVLNSHVTDRQNDAQAAAQTGIDRIANQLRNNAAAATDQKLGIDKVSSYDLVFQTAGKTRPVGSSN